MFAARDVLSLFATFAGVYEGAGLNPEGQAFTGRLHLRPRLDGRVYELEYEAIGAEGARFHHELGLVSAGPDGRLGLWLIHTGSTSLMAHPIEGIEPTEEGGYTLVFGGGDAHEGSRFRMQLTLGLHPGGDLSWSHAWGLPGGELSARSVCRMSR